MGEKVTSLRGISGPVGLGSKLMGNDRLCLPWVLRSLKGMSASLPILHVGCPWRGYLAEEEAGVCQEVPLWVRGPPSDFSMEFSNC